MTFRIRPDSSIDISHDTDPGIERLEITLEDDQRYYFMINVDEHLAGVATTRLEVDWQRCPRELTWDVVDRRKAWRRQQGLWFRMFNTETYSRLIGYIPLGPAAPAPRVGDHLWVYLGMSDWDDVADRDVEFQQVGEKLVKTIRSITLAPEERAWPSIARSPSSSDTY
jgi:hypothetical protein